MSWIRAFYANWDRPFVRSKMLCNVYYSIPIAWNCHLGKYYVMYIMQSLLHGIVTLENTGVTLLRPIHILQKTFVRMATYKDGYPLTPGPFPHTDLPFFFNLGYLVFLTFLSFSKVSWCMNPSNGIGASNKSK